MHSVVSNMISDFGGRARITRDKNAFGVYRNGFANTTTSDGVALYSNAHTSLSGATIDNLETATLDDSALDTLISNLYEQEAQDATIAGHLANSLVVPAKLYKTAVEVTDSELRSGTANNDINVFSSKYGITIHTTPYLGAAVGDNGSDTAYYLNATNHSITRWVRQGIDTRLINWENQRNNNYIYKGEYREVTGVMNYEGSVASNGTT